VSDRPAEREVLFIGGTGRSGTHALARLVGHHSRFADVPIEARFHCNRLGMPDLIEGRVTVGRFLDKLRGFWWHRVRVDGRPRGLYNLSRRADFDRAVERFERAWADAPIEACRKLFCDLLWPVAERTGTPALVEMSSHNIKEAQTLRRLFPQARFLHALRDGRDAAASVSGKTWGPRSAVAAIGWWQERLAEIERGVRGEEDGAPYALPADRFRVVLLDDLVAHRREEEYADLLDFLGVGDEEAIHSHFDRELTAEAAHVGRWRTDLGPASRMRAQRRYRRAVAELERDGNHAAPVLRAALDREER
jgi:hypothetical protein